MPLGKRWIGCMLIGIGLMLCKRAFRPDDDGEFPKEHHRGQVDAGTCRNTASRSVGGAPKGMRRNDTSLGIARRLDRKDAGGQREVCEGKRFSRRQNFRRGVDPVRVLLRR